MMSDDLLEKFKFLGFEFDQQQLDAVRVLRAAGKGGMREPPVDNIVNWLIDARRRKAIVEVWETGYMKITWDDEPVFTLSVPPIEPQPKPLSPAQTEEE